MCTPAVVSLHAFKLMPETATAVLSPTAPVILQLWYGPITTPLGTSNLGPMNHVSAGIGNSSLIHRQKHSSPSLQPKIHDLLLTAWSASSSSYSLVQIHHYTDAPTYSHIYLFQTANNSMARTITGNNLLGGPAIGMKVPWWWVHLHKFQSTVSIQSAISSQ